MQDAAHSLPVGRAVGPGVGSCASRYIGRFAPSPTGPLHFGSLVAAVGSYLHARQAQGLWRLRMEDVDTERNVPGAAEHILRSLEAFGFEWDGAVMVQTQRLAAYAEALEQLKANGDVYPCACSRSEITRIARGRPRAEDGGWIYPGRCREGLPAGASPRAWRMRVGPAPIRFDDALQGPIAQALDASVGDFVLKRADGPYAYQLAVVVDDAAQGITHVVRGADLIDSTPRQIWLQERLGLPTPAYLHLPVVLDASGDKLSKQTHAAPLDEAHAVEQLSAALRFLGQEVPAEITGVSVKEWWSWALAHFAISRLPCRRGLPMPARVP